MYIETLLEYRHPASHPNNYIFQSFSSSVNAVNPDSPELVNLPRGLQANSCSSHSGRAIPTFNERLVDTAPTPCLWFLPSRFSVSLIQWLWHSTNSWETIFSSRNIYIARWFFFIIFFPLWILLFLDIFLRLDVLQLFHTFFLFVFQ